MVDPAGPHWLLTSFALFFATFVHEDVAIVAGAASITEADLPWAAAQASLILGVIASDCTIYGLGVLANRVPRVRALVITQRVQQARQWLNEHLILAVIVCHLIPGLLFPTFVACGWFRISLRRFALASSLMAAAYVSVMLFVWHRFGALVRDHISYWAWAVAALVALTLTAWMAGRPRWETLSAAASHLNALRSEAVATWRRNIARVSHQGMPAIGRMTRRATFGEYLPPGLFYLPLILQWLLLALRYGNLTLPTAANPSIASGGFWGESKTACLDLVAPGQRKWLADYITFRRSADPHAVRADGFEALTAVREAGFGFPLVAKPDVGWQGYGVRLVESEEELTSYVAAFPQDESIIFQRYIPFDGEAGVFYVRLPGEPHGTIHSLTLRYFPHVVGDGVSSLAHLILSDPRASFKAAAHLGTDRYHRGLSDAELARIPAKDEVVRLSFIGSIRVGGLYRDASASITPALTRRFDDICDAMTEFYYGRFDIRFRSMQHLEGGEDFSIIEINGTGSEPLQAWDPNATLLNAYAILLRQQRLLFRIGALNRARGFRPATFASFWNDYQRQRRLVDRYPVSS